MHGIGIYRWLDGRKYTGEYVEDQKFGYGIFEWQDTRKYMGYWVNG